MLVRCCTTVHAYDAVAIGADQAGLSASYHLRGLGSTTCPRRGADGRSYLNARLIDKIRIQVEALQETIARLTAQGIDTEAPKSPDGSDDFWTSWFSGPQGIPTSSPKRTSHEMPTARRDPT
ncbi:MAG: hypothetical protein AVDCRST_MAG02-4528 [uncultured Rubrobacteraceae bacterium]|uniref:Uncharacterized protein n=1 Tax=uncultured Rubrobacteraceae bacterium TaxID=349277 RepID=A0A6J4S1Y2_9ACTN|nr:MAG: hypothetical protein AVDCRST_MAG02-4528 [uncultured Rubrobacteraceae bacterium]